MNISIIGTSYTGLITGACFSELGTNVTCADTESRNINMLQYGGMPIYEPGLEDMVHRNVNGGRLKFSTDMAAAMKGAEVVFCCVNTPQAQDGGTDMTRVIEMAKAFGRSLEKYKVLVIKSPVPVGSSKKIKQIVVDELAERKADIDFDVVSIPDFLTEGNGIKDFMNPDRVIMGMDSDRPRQTVMQLYGPLISIGGLHVIYTDTTTAEMIKYAATAMLATRISYMNEIANLCEVVGADVNTVRLGVGTDSRIGSKYIYPGCGYGGNLFTKDIFDLLKIGQNNGYELDVLKSVDSVNARQKRILFDKLQKRYGNGLAGKTVALWGLSFKPETDDLSGAPSIVTLELLLKAGCTVKVFDPVAMNTCKVRWNDIQCGVDMYDAVKDADALLLLTEWRQFRIPDWDRVKQNMRVPLVIDGRNIYDAAEMERRGFEYMCIGK